MLKGIDFIFSRFSRHHRLSPFFFLSSFFLYASLVYLTNIFFLLLVVSCHRHCRVFSTFLSILSLIAIRPFIIVLSTLTLIIVSVNPFLLFKRLSHPHRSCFSYHHWSATTSQTAFTAITSLIHDFIYHRLTLSISGGARSDHQAFHPRLLQVPKRSLSQEEPIPFTIRVSVSHA